MRRQKLPRHDMTSWACVIPSMSLTGGLQQAWQRSHWTSIPMILTLGLDCRHLGVAPRTEVCRLARAGIIAPAMRDGEAFSASMCNPPFFETLAEAGRNPATAFGGTPAEMVCVGGERAFVLQMVQDSQALRARPRTPLLMVECGGGVKTELCAIVCRVACLGTPMWWAVRPCRMASVPCQEP